MRNSFLRAAALCLTLPATAALAHSDGASDNPFANLEFDTKGGFKVSTRDGRSAFKVGGRLHLDHDFYDGIYNPLDNDERSSEFEIRRARFGFSGKFDSNWKYKLIFNIDDPDNEATVHQGYLTYTGFRPFDVTVGRFKRPVGLEVLTSSNWVTSIERSAIFEAIPFNNNAEVGAQISGTLFDQIGWAAGLFDDGSEDAETGNDTYAVHGRVFFTPLRRKTQLIHLGMSYGDQNPGDGSTTRSQSRLGVHTLSSSTFQFSNTVERDSDRFFGVELAWMDGPFSLQGEYLSREIDVAEGAPESEVDISGGYVQFAWTITGESRGYKFPAGAFAGIKPKGDRGAWEVFTKYEYVDASAIGLGESDAQVYVGGVSWYATRNIKATLNYLHADTTRLAGTGTADDGDAVITRVQFVF